MAKYSNPNCKWWMHDGTTCNAPTWTLPNGLRINTPYCEQHAKEWSDSRMTDLECRY